MPLAVLRIVACAIWSEQGDGLPLGEGLIGTLDNPQIEVLYKEILKAISKRELLEDLVKYSLCWRVSPGKVHQPDRHH